MDELDLMLSDMEAADPLYRPTNFWQSGLASIVTDLRRHGFERFREHESAQFFYVPLHSRTIWRRQKWLVSLLLAVAGVIARSSAVKLREVMNGNRKARDEYRLFRAANPAAGLPLDVSESDIGGGERFEVEGRLYSRSFLNYLRGLTFLKKLTNTDDVRSILEIGGGYGTLGEILLKSRPDGFYVDVDIPPVAAVASYYLKQVFGEHAVLSYEQSRDMQVIDLDELRKSYRAVVLCAWQLPRVKGHVDVFANFISFQEMEPEVVANYVKVVQPLVRKAVLLRNSVRGKVVASKPGEIGVFEPTTTDHIIRNFDQFELLGRDSAIFGEENPRANFRSEVLCMQRRSME